MEKKTHRLWEVQTDGDDVVIRRSQLERNDWDEATMEQARNVAASIWGVVGANMIDDPMFLMEVPSSLVVKLNKAANDLSKKACVPNVVLERSELYEKYSKEAVDEAMLAIAQGMKARRLSKYYNVPLVLAYDLMDKFADIDKKELLDIINTVRTGGLLNKKLSSKTAAEVSVLWSEYSESGLHKVAIDDAAKEYWEKYYGPFGKELVRDIRKRVRADLAKKWLTKVGLDQAAIEYWSNYYGEYGKLLTREDIVKERKPSKKD